MALNFKINLFFLSFVFQGFTQTVSFEVQGFVSEFGDSTYFIANAEIFILNEKDTVAKIKSDKKGYYQWQGNFHEGDELFVCGSHKYFLKEETNFKVTHINTQLNLNFTLRERHYYNPQFPIYEMNEIEKFSNFDIEFCKHQFRKYKNICIKFSQWQNPNESKRVGIKRMKKFKKLLLKNGFSTENFSFELVPIVMNCSNETDCRSKIQGLVISTGEKCN